MGLARTSLLRLSRLGFIDCLAYTELGGAPYHKSQTFLEVLTCEKISNGPFANEM
jgi:hypothetical protein